MFANQKKRLHERLSRAAAGSLEPDETLVASTYVIQQPNLLLFVGAVALVSGALALGGYELRMWVIVGSVSAFLLVNVRYFFLLLTDRRLIYVRLSQFSQKRWRIERTIPRIDVTSVDYGKGWLNDALRIVTRDGSLPKVKVGPPWKHEARDLVDQLRSPSTPTPARDLRSVPGLPARPPNE